MWERRGGLRRGAGVSIGLRLLGQHGAATDGLKGTWGVRPQIDNTNYAIVCAFIEKNGV